MLNDTDLDGNQDSPQQIGSRQSIPNWQDQPVSAETSYCQASTVGTWAKAERPGQPKKDHQEPAVGTRTARRSVLRRHPATSAMAAILITAALGGGYLYWDYASHFERGFLIPAANVQPEEVQKFKKDFVKFQEDVKQKFQSLIEKLRHGDLPEGFAKTNGRIEATEIDVSPKYAGRLESVLVDEGYEVKAGQVVAVIKSPEYEAQLRTAQANVLVAKSSLASAVAKVAQAKADKVFAQNDLERGKPLVQQGWMTKQQFDQRVDKADASKAALDAAEMNRDAAQSLVISTQAEVDRISSIITDLTLLSPRDGRIQYRIHRSGEVVNAGTRILQILDLNDVYMTIYLPAAQAGKLGLGDEARLILDPFPDLVIPAHVSFVATEAQFTPKPVETAQEREKLIFRVKLEIDRKVLSKYHAHVKTGVRGMGFVRTKPGVPWPENLAVKLPDESQVQSGQVPRQASYADKDRKEAKEDQSEQAGENQSANGDRQTAATKLAISSAGTLAVKLPNGR
jgi:HlyD family secretion protein